MKPAKTRTTASAEQLIYIGPSIRSIALAQYTVFSDGKLPERITKQVEVTPELNHFIVPVSKLIEIERKIEDKASAYNLQFAKLKQLA